MVISSQKYCSMEQSSGIQTRNPWVLRLWNTCAKKTAENVFNVYSCSLFITWQLL